MTKTLSSSFNVGDYFKVTDGPWRGISGKITAIYDKETFNYIDCNTGQPSVMLYYVLGAWSRKIKECD